MYNYSEHLDDGESDFWSPSQVQLMDRHGLAWYQITQRKSLILCEEKKVKNAHQF